MCTFCIVLCNLRATNNLRQALDILWCVSVSSPCDLQPTQITRPHPVQGDPKSQIEPKALTNVALHATSPPRRFHHDQTPIPNVPVRQRTQEEGPEIAQRPSRYAECRGVRTKHRYPGDTQRSGNRLSMSFIGCVCILISTSRRYSYGLILFVWHVATIV